jgi:hypothetical protein
MSLGLTLAALLAASQGCTTWQGGIPGYFRNRLKDTLEIADLGVTVTKTPQFSFYAALLSVGPGGYGDVDGTFIGMGGGDIGAMPIYYHHFGFLVYGREKTAWGNSIWNYPEYDPNNPETFNSQGVGILGFVTPPFDARPAGRPT